MVDDRSRRAVEMSEEVADGCLSPPALEPISKAAEAAWHAVFDRYEGGAEKGAAAAAFYVSGMTLYQNDLSNAMGAVTEAMPDAVDAERQTQVAIIRDVLGNPFRPVALDPNWLTSAVVGLAETLYTDRAWDRLPVLADALDDAGCADPDVLGHLRGPGPHARGCWVVDLILGKS